MPLHTQEVADKLRAHKVGMFSERANTQDVLDYALSGVPRQYRAFMTTSLMLYHNTLLELLAKDAEIENARPNSN